MKNVISLSEFMNFSTKKSTSSRMKAVKDIKYKPDYHPGVDYWKKLRDEIKKIHENNLPIENLKNIVFSVPIERQENYRKNINAYINFFKKHNPEYFPVGKALWDFDDNLSVRAYPELGLIINGKPYLVKIHYKSTNKELSKPTIQTTLTAMMLAKSDYVLPEKPTYAVLNLANRKIYESDKLLDNDVTLLKADAFQFSFLWTQV